MSRVWYVPSVGSVRSEIERLRLFGRTSGSNLLDWSWVENQLTNAGTYWVNARSESYPHPRPVWGIWFRDSLVLSIGSPKLIRCIEANPDITVHLESGTDVVVVEGNARVSHLADAQIIDAYNAKYEWQYTYDEYGPLTQVNPKTVLSWRSTGWAGRNGIQETGRWRFES